jgi:hypothetical protein
MPGTLLIAALVLGHTYTSSDVYSLTKYWILAAGLSLGLLVSPCPRTKLDSPAALFLGALALCCMMSPDPIVSFIGQYAFYYQALIPSLLVFFALQLGSSHHPSVLLKALVWSCVLASIWGFGQKLGLTGSMRAFDGGRIYAGVGNPVFLALHLALGLIASVILGYKWPLPIIGLALALTASRAGILAVAAGGLVLGFTRLKSHPRAFWSLMAGCLLALFAVQAIRPPTTSSDLGRHHMARLGLQAHSRLPWFGVGPDRFYKVLELDRDAWLEKDLGAQWSNGYSHNSFLDALATGGRVLFAAYLVLLASITCVLIRTHNYGCLALGAALLTFSLFQPTPLTAKAIYAMLLGAHLEDEGYWWDFQSNAFRLTVLGIAGLTSMFFVGGRMNLVSLRLDSEPSAHMAARRMLPSLTR